MTISRRQALLVIGAVLVAPACGSSSDEDPATCGGTLSPAEQQTRASLGYAEQAADPTKTCNGCQQYVVRTAPGQCGTCKLLTGPVRASATCRAFTPKG